MHNAIATPKSKSELFRKLMNAASRFDTKHNVEANELEREWEFFTKIRENEFEWIMPSTPFVRDALVWRHITDVTLLLRTGEPARVEFGTEWYKPKKDKVDACDVIWSKKTIKETTEAMWLAFENENRRDEYYEMGFCEMMMMKEIEEYFGK